MSDQPTVESVIVQVTDPEVLTAALSERYRGRLVIFAVRRLRGDHTAAEDVVQEALRTVLELLRAGRIREPAALPTFAFETVRNLCMHHGRAAGREGSTLDRYAVLPANPPDDVLTQVIKEERRRSVRAAMDRLDEEDRRVLDMTYVELRTSEDIGRELGLSAVAVRVRRHRALQRLGAFLRVTLPSGREQE